MNLILSYKWQRCRSDPFCAFPAKSDPLCEFITDASVSMGGNCMLDNLDNGQKSFTNNARLT